MGNKCLLNATSVDSNLPLFCFLVITKKLLDMLNSHPLYILQLPLPLRHMSFLLSEKLLFAYEKTLGGKLLLFNPDYKAVTCSDRGL